MESETEKPTTEAHEYLRRNQRASMENVYILESDRT